MTSLTGSLSSHDFPFDFCFFATGVSGVSSAVLSNGTSMRNTCWHSAHHCNHCDENEQDDGHRSSSWKEHAEEVARRGNRSDAMLPL